MNVTELAEYVRDARQRTLDLVADLSDEDMLGPKLRIVNPPLWEIGHVAWFQEHWVLRNLDGRPPILSNADAIYDSMAVAHDTRWDLHLPSRNETTRYLCEVRDGVLERLQSGQPSQADMYFNLLSIFHEDMHNEAFTYTRQTHGYPAPKWSDGAVGRAGDGAMGGTLPGDAAIPGGPFMLG